MKIEPKHVLYYAIGPAVLTGALSLAPKAYEVFFETRQSLEYTLTTSAPIVGDVMAQQVVSVRIANTGRKPLNAVVADLRIPGATVMSSSVRSTTGSSYEEKRSGGTVSVKVPKLLAAEEFAISALIRSDAMPQPAEMTLRSEEVLGQPAPALGAKKSDFGLTAISALVSGTAVLLMSLLGLRKFPRFLRAEKRAAIMYIALATQNNVFIGTVLKLGEDPTYLEFADLLLAFGRTASDSRGLAVSGLRCLLTITSMAEGSRALVQRNLAQLQGPGATSVTPPTQSFKAMGDQSLAFRGFVDQEFGLAPKSVPSAA